MTTYGYATGQSRAQRVAVSSTRTRRSDATGTARGRSGATVTAGLASLTTAGFQVHPVAGWVAAGLSLFALDHLRGPRA